jgi:endonuclease/exonuclease/phosphatase family metal-dependent hydrolase
MILVPAAAVAIRLGLFPRTDTDEPTKPDAEATTFRVATYNINYGNPQLELVVKAILESKADIVALQETTADSESYLRKELAGQFPHMVFQGFKGKYYAERFGFLSKCPITLVRYIEPEYGLFGTYFAIIEINRAAIQAVNVHLQPANMPAVRSLAGFVAVVRDTEAIHGEEIERIFGSLDQDVPTIILGDFNSLPGFKAPTFLEGKGFCDGAASTQEGAQAAPTFWWPTKLGRVYFRMDYIFHDPAFRTVNNRVIRNNSSDHFLLVSELELNRVDPRQPQGSTQHGE